MKEKYKVHPESGINEGKFVYSLLADISYSNKGRRGGYDGLERRL
jgi:hypothetical protein